MPPERLRKDPGGLDRRGEVEVADDDERLNREAPRPPLASRIVDWIADNLHDTIERLPHRRVEHRQLARFDAWTLGRSLLPDRSGINGAIERPLPQASDEQPLRQSRSTTAAIAWPWPMHIVARP
jgi:hypothetical protein